MTMDMWFQQDMSGGENSLLPPDSIGENEVAELVNLLPRRTSKGVELRKGFQTMLDVGKDVMSVFAKKATTGVVHLLAAVNDANTMKIVHYGDISGIAPTIYRAADAVDATTLDYPRIQSLDDGSVRWFEDFTSDAWYTALPAPVGDLSYWDDGSTWYAASSDSAVEFVFTSPASTHSVRLLTTVDPLLEPGAYYLYLKKGAGAFSLVGDYLVGEDVEVPLVAGDAGENRLKVVPKDAPLAPVQMTGGIVTGLQVVPIITGTTVHTFTTAAASTPGIWWSDWDGDRLFFSNGMGAANNDGLYTWNLTGSAAKVQDKSQGGTVYMPGLRYLTQHKGRLFGVHQSGNSSYTTVYVCGSDDSTNARWESWSGLGDSDGGSVDVTPYGTDIVALASSYGGLVVFKEDTISLWSYTEAGAPWDATKGAQIDLLNSGVGCISHESITANDDVLLFMGRTDSRDIALFSLSNGEVRDQSVKVPRKMQTLAWNQQGQMSAEMYDNYYVLIGSINGADTSVIAVFDMENQAWATLTGVEAICTLRHPSHNYVVLGSADGRLYRYPSNLYLDPNGEKIQYKVLTRRMFGNSLNNDVYYRMVWLSGGAGKPMDVNVIVHGDTGQKFYATPVQFESGFSDTWNDGTNWSDGTYWGQEYELDEYYTELDFRSRGAQLEVSGESNEEFYLDMISVGSRARRVRRAKYA